ncbi:hypothetical protein MLD38_006094 [Melastoma candidum]|uniref:Uncharacterized protein n=1 Tax=Melastoma candidum TaxID=119954 RepID=A0ACB9RQJ6_9MYRT|nr:hypothetical protein MLD38_006094 [Melastoma candidum]
MAAGDNSSRSGGEGGGAGGKVMRDGRINRYRARSSTPYDRPSNTNWISKLPRAIVSGAGVLLNSVFGPDPSSSSSSSSASGVDGAEEVNTSEKGAGLQLEPELDVGRSFGSKKLIEGLIVQQTFSREECHRLTDLIKARVVNTPDNIDGVGFPPGARQKQPFEKGENLPGYYSKAAMEAKKWFEGRKLGLTSEFDLDKGTSSLSPISAHLNSGEPGSPADMAKSYMKERRPWSSQHLNNTGSTTEVPDPKEDALLSIGWNSLSPPPNSQLKRDSPITGSWNISEEIRKVRSRATKDMLRTVSSPKVDKPSGFMPASPFIPKINWSDSAPVDKSAAQSPVNNSVPSNLGDEMPSAPRTLDVLSETAIPEVALELPEGIGSDGGAATNNHPASALSAPPPAVLNLVKDANRAGEETSAGGGLTLPPASPPPLREDCELLSEASVEVPVIDETDGAAAGSESTPNEEISEDVAIISLARKSDSTRPARNTRRVRGRSK